MPRLCLTSHVGRIEDDIIVRFGSKCITIRLVQVARGQARISVEADEDVAINRRKIDDAILAEFSRGGGTEPDPPEDEPA